MSREKDPMIEKLGGIVVGIPGHPDPGERWGGQKGRIDRGCDWENCNGWAYAQVPLTETTLCFRHWKKGYLYTVLVVQSVLWLGGRCSKCGAAGTAERPLSFRDRRGKPAGILAAIKELEIDTLVFRLGEEAKLVCSKCLEYKGRSFRDNWPMPDGVELPWRSMWMPPGMRDRFASAVEDADDPPYIVRKMADVLGVAVEE